MEKNKHFILGTFLTILLLFFSITNFAKASVADTPNSNFYITNGNVTTSALSPDGSTLYVGGSFTYVGPNNGHGANVSSITGIPSSIYPMVNGNILASVSDGSGGLYIGGSFNKVGQYDRTGLAHILADGSVDTNFNIDLRAGRIRATVYSLAMDGTTLYIGGEFFSFGAEIRSDAAAIDTTDNSITSWNPFALGPVRSLVIDGSVIYAGGDFTTIGGESRNYIAALNNTDGTATAWDGNANGGVNTLAVSGHTIYAGGAFTNIGGETRNHIAALNDHNGAATAWDPNADGDIYTLAVDGDLVYAGGAFTNIGGENHNYIVALDNVTGAATAWNPGVDGMVNSLAIGSEVIYVGGYFYSIGGEIRNNIAAIDKSSALATDWSPNASDGVLSLLVNGSDVYIGGAFRSIGGKSRNNIAALDINSSSVTTWNPSADSGVATLTVTNSAVYVGGYFTFIGGESRNHLAALDINSGLATTWDPNIIPVALAQGYVGDNVNAIVVSGNLVYVAGSFYKIGGQDRVDLAALDISTGLANDWSPNPSISGFGIYPSISTMQIVGSTVYVGGSFYNIGGEARNNIAAIDKSSGLATDWNSNADAVVNTLVVNNNIVYIGGYFITVGGEVRNNIAAIDKSSGLVTAWDPNASGNITALAVVGNTIYAGGNFYNIGGEDHNYLAALNNTDGLAISSWNPSLDDQAFSLTVGQSAIYVGGAFMSINDNVCPSLAVFNFSAPLPPSNLLTDNITTKSLNLFWTDNSEDETGFTVDSSTDGIVYNNIGTVASNVSSINISNLLANTKYWFRVAAINNETVSNYINISATTKANSDSGGIFTPAGIGSGVADKIIDMNKTVNIGAINNLGINLLAYLNSKAIFQALVSHNYQLETHSLIINNIDLSSNKTIQLTIESTPQIINLKLNESTQLDLDNDNIKDIEIKFANLWVNRAELTIKSLLNQANNNLNNNNNNNNKPIIKVIKFIFKKNLKLGDINNDVKELQKYLNNNNFIIVKTGPGSKGKETTRFGLATKNALIKFQKAKKIIPSNGVFGTTTRFVVNK